MKTLITGATGFLGNSIARALQKTGAEIKLLIRKSSNTSTIQDIEAEKFVGDIQDPLSIKNALRGCNHLYHVAADYRLWARRSKDLYDNNVLGTKNIMLGALEGGIERVVYTSSVATIGVTKDGAVSDESTQSKLSDMIGHYKRSKFLAEKEVDRLIRTEGLPAVIVNPSTPIGPRDAKPTPTGRIILDAINGRMPAYVNTGLNIAHVDDIATGHILAFQRGAVGERYILGGEDLTLKEILFYVAKASGGRPPRICLPRQLIFPIAYISEFWAWLTNGPAPQATVEGLKMAAYQMYFSSDKARRELNYKSRSAVTAIEDATKWFDDFVSK
jgi:dihydroflavonol-4-reductase